MHTTLAESLIASNLLSPPILFFFLGVGASLMKSDLEIPPAITKMLSLYLLFAIGFKGGVQLRTEGIDNDVVMAVVSGVALSLCVPVYVFALLRKKLGPATAAGVGATYGSVSVVTFLAAKLLLDQRGVDHGGHMVAVTAIMESPAVVVAVLLARLFPGAESGAGDGPRPPLRRVLHDVLCNGAMVLLVGSLVVGAVSVPVAQAKVMPFSNDLFYGLLCFFLLDLGMLAGKSLGDVAAGGARLVLTALCVPLVNAAAALGLAKLTGLSMGDGFLLIVLASSGSYIAVPAALKIALPEAKASIFVPMALAITFPFNIVAGLPLYWAAAEWALGAARH